MKKIKGIIFDLDGTLADTLPLCIRAFKESVEPILDRPVQETEIIATFGASEEGTIMALTPNHYKRGVSQYLRYYETLHGICPVTFDGINPLLHNLRRKAIRLGIVTGKGEFSTAISLKRFGIQNLFDIVETGSPSGPRKATGIEKVLAKWTSLEKDEVIYVGDAPGDILASRKAGIAVVSAAWAYTCDPEELKPLQPDQLFYSIPDFEKWLMEQI